MSIVSPRTPDPRSTGTQAVPNDQSMPLVVRPIIVEGEEAYRRDLPQLLLERPGQWVAYHGNTCLGFHKKPEKLYQDSAKRGLDPEDVLVLCIEPVGDAVLLGPGPCRWDEHGNSSSSGEK